MQIHFDTGNAAELAAVAAMIAHLRGDDGLHNDIAQAIANSNARMGAPEPLRGEPDIRVVTPAPAPAPTPAPSDAPDPAEAFDGADPAQAFGAVPLAPPAPPVSPAADTAAATIPTPALVPSPPANPGGVEVDKGGLPWDGRIHSGPADKKPKNADGTWRKRRGATDDEVAAVEAELRAALNAPAAPVAPVAEAPAAPVPPAPPVAAAPVPAPPAPVPAAPVPMAAPIAPAPTPAPADTASGPAAATPAPSAPASTFAELMRKITSLQAAGTLTVEGTAQISAALGIGGVRDLITRPDLVPSFDALLPGAA